MRKGVFKWRGSAAPPISAARRDAKVRTSEATRSPLSRVVISVAGALATEGGKDEAARIAPTRPRASEATLDNM